MLQKPLVVLASASVIGSLPLFLFAIDWGRFIYIHLVSMFLVLLVIEAETGAYENRGIPGTWVVSEVANSKIMRTVVLFLFALAYAGLWHVPHCCGKPVLSKPPIIGLVR